MKPRAPSLAALNLLALGLLACSGDLLRSCTSTVVGETVEAGKGLSRGVSEGIEEGRKQGASIDGATIVASGADLVGLGDIAVFSVAAEEGGCVATVALSNDSDGPLRFIRIKAAGLDVDGFVIEPESSVPAEFTVPPHAKDRILLDFALPPDRLGQVRFWERDLPVTAEARARGAAGGAPATE